MVAVVEISPKALPNWKGINVSMVAATWTKATGKWELIPGLLKPAVPSGIEAEEYPDTLFFVFRGLDFAREGSYDLRFRISFRSYNDTGSNETSFPPEELWRQGTFPSTPEQRAKYEWFEAGGLRVTCETAIHSTLNCEGTQSLTVSSKSQSTPNITYPMPLVVP